MFMYFLTRSALLLIATAFFAGSPEVSSAASPECRKILPGMGVAAGFGAPWNALSPQKELLLKVYCNKIEAHMDIGTGMFRQHMYTEGYDWTGNTWQEHLLAAEHPKLTEDSVQGHAKDRPDLDVEEIDFGVGTTGRTSSGAADGTRWTIGGGAGGTTGGMGAWHFNPPKGSADEFRCLAGRNRVKKVSGTHTTRYMDRPSEGQAYDGRRGTFIVQREVRQSAINLAGYAKDVCWAGGFITSTFRNFDTYRFMKDMDHAGMRWESGTSEVTGVQVFFTEDGLRPARQAQTANSYFTIAHSWIDHIRADCIENDSLGSGLVYDTLLNGCSTGISMRAGGGVNPDMTHNTVTFDHVLMYIEPMPWPNCTLPGDKCSRKEGVNKITVDGVPYGTSNLIKVRSGSPRMIIKDSIFVAHMKGRNPVNSLDIPDNLKGCSNNIIVWLGDGEYPGKYPRDCFTVTKDVNVWVNAVKDWHERHPNVGANRKPAAHLVGSVVFPRPVELRPPQ